jgi:hypothetical protein
MIKLSNDCGVFYGIPAVSLCAQPFAQIEMEVIPVERFLVVLGVPQLLLRPHAGAMMSGIPRSSSQQQPLSAADDRDGYQLVAPPQVDVTQMRDEVRKRLEP